MSKDDETTPPWVNEIHAHLRSISDRQRRTARAVADLALGMNAETKAAKARHQELLGIALAKHTMAVGGEREDTDRFKLANGAEVELSRARQAQIVRWLIVAVKAALLLGAGALAKWVHELATR